jgi:endoglucanase
MEGNMARAQRYLGFAGAGLAVFLSANACGGGGEGGMAGPENTVEVVLAGAGTGVVTSNPPAITCPGACGPLDWSPGATVELIATPNTGSTFGGWSGACTGTGMCSFVVNGHMKVTATFN